MLPLCLLKEKHSLSDMYRNIHGLNLTLLGFASQKVSAVLGVRMKA